MNTPSEIKSAADAIEILTAAAIAEAVGTDERTVTNKQSGQFPSWWFPYVSDAAKAAGLSISTDAFNFSRKLPRRAS